MDMNKIVDEYMNESEVDYIALWQLSQTSRDELGANTTDQARSISLELVRRLYERGLRPGGYWGADFDYWPDEGCQAALERIEQEWIALGHDPNPAEPICWFAPRPE
ncbi:MAG TPA: hypothetical protein VE993_02685 [Stellaceae bacterium]|nr:hypothetical protein [Stellaceae bacterium]